MFLRVCVTLDATRHQASASADLAKKPYDESAAAAAKPPGCEIIPAFVTLLRKEPAIQPFKAWANSVDPDGKYVAKLSHQGQHYVFHTAPKIQQVTYYFSSVRTPAGTTHTAWVEIPERPYVVEYLAGLKARP